LMRFWIIKISGFYFHSSLLSLAKVNFERAWVRPQIVEENIIQIISGRHPLVESCVESYVTNDTHLVRILDLTDNIRTAFLTKPF
jgi:DNA mismatch repair ATPase MutS